AATCTDTANWKMCTLRKQANRAFQKRLNNSTEIGSNAYTIKGTFPQDKQKMLDQITWLKEHPEVVRPQGLRGF
ncbi:MAG: hypothetical protein P8X83_02415, partial [Nitrosopumilaceae archaeon]